MFLPCVLRIDFARFYRPTSVNHVYLAYPKIFSDQKLIERCRERVDVSTVEDVRGVSVLFTCFFIIPV